MDSMKYFGGVILTFIAIVSTVFAQNNCPQGLTSDLEQLLTIGDYCYFFSSEELSYSQSNNSCAEKGGYLAVVTDATTAQALANHANTTSDITAKSSFWIGLRKENSTFTSSVLGGEVKYMNFLQTRATGMGQTGCVKIDLPDANGQWVTENCANRDWFNGFICQYAGQNSAQNLKTLSVFTLVALVLSRTLL